MSHYKVYKAWSSTPDIPRYCTTPCVMRFMLLCTQGEMVLERNTLETDKDRHTRRNFQFAMSNNCIVLQHPSAPSTIPLTMPGVRYKALSAELRRELVYQCN